EDVADLAGADHVGLGHQVGHRGRGVAHALLGHEGLTEFAQAEIEGDHDRGDQGELHRGDAPAIPTKAAQQGHENGSLRKDVVEDSTATPPSSRDRALAMNGVTSGCRYQVRTRMMSPASPPSKPRSPSRNVPFCIGSGGFGSWKRGMTRTSTLSRSAQSPVKPTMRSNTAALRPAASLPCAGLWPVRTGRAAARVAFSSWLLSMKTTPISMVANIMKKNGAAAVANSTAVAPRRSLAER